MATTDTNPNRDITVSKDQIDQLIFALRCLPRMPKGAKAPAGVDSPEQLIKMLEEARDGDSDGIYSFVL